MDGFLECYRRTQTADPGRMPVWEWKRIFSEYYEEKTVGITRYWTAFAHDQRADLLITINGDPGITTDERVKLFPDSRPGGWFKILQVQHLRNEDGLPVTDLTLSRLGDGYDTNN